MHTTQSHKHLSCISDAHANRHQHNAPAQPLRLFRHSQAAAAWPARPVTQRFRWRAARRLLTAAVGHQCRRGCQRRRHVGTRLEGHRCRSGSPGDRALWNLRQRRRLREKLLLWLRPLLLLFVSAHPRCATQHSRRSHTHASDAERKLRGLPGAPAAAAAAASAPTSGGGERCGASFIDLREKVSDASDTHVQSGNDIPTPTNRFKQPAQQLTEQVAPPPIQHATQCVHWLDATA